MTEKETKQTLRCRLEALDRQQLAAFCSFLGFNGASFYTMRDKLVYDTGWFDEWELKGVEGMIREFDPDYRGEAKDYFAEARDKSLFIQYMVEKGGMGKTTCYQRFKIFNFKKWEVTGLEKMFDQFMDFHKEERA